MPSFCSLLSPYKIPFCLVVAGLILCACAESGSNSGRGNETAALVLTAPRHVLHSLAREPMVVEHPEGALFVAGYGSQVTGVDPNSVPRLWSSRDRGASFEPVDVGTAADGAAGNSDVDLAVAPDGTLYFAAMGFDRSTGAGTHVAMGVSHDVGATWSWTRLSQNQYDDRPWVVVAPDGRAHAIWNDGAGVCYAVSVDGGRSWRERPRIHSAGGSSHLAVGPAGELAARITPLSASGNRFDPDVDLLAVSADGGDSWILHAAPGERTWDPTFRDPNVVSRWVEPLAWDEQGALFYLWSQGRDLWLARSADSGASWISWKIVQEPSVAYFPYLMAGPGSELAATWFTGSGDDLEAHLAVIELAAVEPASEGSSAPRVFETEPFRPDSWVEGTAGDPPVRSPAGEYVPVVYLANGDLAVVTPVQDAAHDRWGFTWWTAERAAR